MVGRRRYVVGVMGPGAELTTELRVLAEEVGTLVAKRGWVLLTGGRAAGVMDAASRGASEAGGLVVGVLPDDGSGSSPISQFVEVAIYSGMGSARNNINVLSSDVVIACGMGAGTASEVALALKAGKKVILAGVDVQDADFFLRLSSERVRVAHTAREAIEVAAGILDNSP